MEKLVAALEANNCASYTAPKELLDKCAHRNGELIALLVVALKEAVKGPNAAHCGGACNRLLIQALTGESPEQAPEEAQSLDKITINRDGQPPIAFSGELIGKADNKVGSNGNRANRWIEVDIYRTQGGNFVAQISRYTCWQGESDRFDAKSFTTAAEVIEWLKEGESNLGSVSQEAVEKAAKIAPEFAESWIEQVE